MKVQAGLALMSLIAMCSSTGQVEVIIPPPPLDDPIVTTAFDFLVLYLKSQGDFRVRRPLAVLRATKQVVAGLKYVITLRISTFGSEPPKECTVPYLQPPYPSQQPVLTGSITCGSLPVS